MSLDNRYNSALVFATAKHEGQYRKGGLPYITHPVAVAEILKDKGYDDRYVITGLFHDLLEDTDASEADIEAIGGKDVLEAVRLLTKTEGYCMADYIGSIKQNPIAKAVKAADRLHNLRCAVVCDEKFKRKYIKESTEWYMDFDSEIPEAVEALAKTLDRHI